MSSPNVTVVFPDAGEPASDLAYEKKLLIGAFLGCAAWGIHLCVYSAAMYFSSISLPHRPQRTWLSWGLMAYMTVLFALATAFVGANIQVNVTNYIIHRDDPGGPYAYALRAFDTPMVLIAIVSPKVLILFTDALLVWRLNVIWHMYWGIYWIIILPIIMFLGSTAMGIFLMFRSIQPGNSLHSEHVVHIETAFWCISLSMSVIVTLLIVGRLVYIQRRTAKILGNVPEYWDHHHISAWTIFLESSAIYTIFGFVNLVLYSQSSPVSDLFDLFMPQVICISSDLIILRVAMGCGWSLQTSTKFTSVLMSPPSPSTTSDVGS